MNKKSKIYLFISLLLVFSILGGVFALFSNNDGKVIIKPSSQKGKWVLVTDVNMLQDNSRIIILANDYYYAMSKQAENNRESTLLNDNGGSFSLNDDVQIIILCKSSLVEGTFELFVDEEKTNRLYAPSSSSNWLKTTTKTTYENACWTIDIIDGKANIVANGSVTRNTIRFNAQSELFSCYAETNSMFDICIFIYVE